MSNRHFLTAICLAYIVGLLTTGLLYFELMELPLAFCAGLVIAGIYAFGASRFIGIRNIRPIAIAFIVSLVAMGSFWLQVPSPQSTNISRFATVKSQLVIVTGKIATEPRLNQNYKLRFWLDCSSLERSLQEVQEVSGRLYVTMPLLAGNSLQPQQLVTLEGSLYLPQDSEEIDFDFARYLRERKTFAGLSAYKVLDRGKAPWGWHRLRQRIIRSQVLALGSPLGQLVSSIVLGRRAVDLPPDIHQMFIGSGLAHILAASGFHVSLLLGFVLRLTASISDRQKRLIIGVATLFLYSCLTGFSPSIIRAGMMGIAVLVATVERAKVRPLGALLVAGIFILLLNPLWIWDLSFQLSFLSTLGIIIMLPQLEKLDFLPPTVVNAMAIPLAATIWVLPLLCYSFDTVATYGILTNVVATPLVSVVSLGGMIASAVALLFPPLGMALAWLLKYPLLLLVAIARLVANLPGSSWATGEVSIWLIIAVYLVLFGVCFHKH